MNIATEQELFKVPISQMLLDTLVRPFEMLATEPILLLLSLYIALIYGLLVSAFAPASMILVSDHASVRILLQLPRRLRWRLPLD